MLTLLKHLKLNITIMVFAVFAIGPQVAHSQTIKETTINSVANGVTEFLDRTQTLVNPVVKPEDLKQITCLANNLYFESAQEPERGMAAVARVVMNRVDAGFGKTPCEVINQSTIVKRQVEKKPGVFETIAVRVCQFSWVCEGKKRVSNKEAYERALEMAHMVYLYDAYDDVVPDNTLFFHAARVNPGWKLKRFDRIGNHVFYTR